MEACLHGGGRAQGKKLDSMMSWPRALENRPLIAVQAAVFPFACLPLLPLKNSLHLLLSSPATIWQSSPFGSCLQSNCSPSLPCPFITSID